MSVFDSGTEDVNTTSRNKATSPRTLRVGALGPNETVQGSLQILFNIFKVSYTMDADASALQI